MSTTTAASGKNRWPDFPPANLDDQRCAGGLLAQQPEYRSGEVAFERAECFQAALAGLLFALQVGAGSGSQRPRTIAILCSALLSCRLPWRPRSSQVTLEIL
jgi:hypothetical protein